MGELALLPTRAKLAAELKPGDLLDYGGRPATVTRCAKPRRILMWRVTLGPSWLRRLPHPWRHRLGLHDGGPFTRPLYRRPYLSHTRLAKVKLTLAAELDFAGAVKRPARPLTASYRERQYVTTYNREENN